MEKEKPALIRSHISLSSILLQFFGCEGYQMVLTIKKYKHISHA